MFIQTRKIRLSETDATGVLYFMNQLKFATEAFETFLEDHYQDLSDVLYHGEELLPIVDVSSQFFAPLQLNDQIEINLFFDEIKTTSFRIRTHIKKNKKLIGQTMVKHVVIDKTTRKRATLPEDFLQLLNEHRAPATTTA